MSASDLVINVEQGTIKIYGVTYALALFHALGFASAGCVFKIVARIDGALTLQALGVAEAEGIVDRESATCALIERNHELVTELENLHAEIRRGEEI